MTTLHPWQALGAVAPNTLTEARLEAHFAVQWLAKTADLLLPAAPDYSHSSVAWEGERAALVTQPLPTRRRTIRLALHLPGLCYQVLDDDGVMEEYPVTDRTHADAGQWLHRVLAGLGVPAAPLQRGSDLPQSEHYLAQGQRYQAHRLGEALRALSAWYGTAATLLAEIAAYAEARRLAPGATPVRCWPHHFDLATLVRLEEGAAETARAVGIGFSPGDETIAEPYFYVTPWPPLRSADWPSLPSPGRWETQAFVGAVAPGSAIVAQDDPPGRVRAFLRTSFDLFLDRLGGLDAVA